MAVILPPMALILALTLALAGAFVVSVEVDRDVAPLLVMLVLLLDGGRPFAASAALPLVIPERSPPRAAGAPLAPFSRDGNTMERGVPAGLAVAAPGVRTTGADRSVAVGGSAVRLPVGFVEPLGGPEAAEASRRPGLSEGNSSDLSWTGEDDGGAGAAAALGALGGTSPSSCR